MMDCKLWDWSCWRLKRWNSAIQIRILRALLWVIRTFGLTLRSSGHGLVYKWVVSPDGGFDHWFDVADRQYTVWTIRNKIGFWRFIVMLASASEFLLGPRRRAHREQVVAESEHYYCSRPIFEIRKSHPRTGASNARNC